MISAYPSTLPVPASSQVTPAERRYLSDERYPTEARAFERQRRTFERVTWPWMNAAKAAEFNAWWTSTLGFGGAWFKASWPSPRGQVETDRHFVSTPSWRFRAGGFWQVSALIETRARGSVPSFAPLVTWDPAVEGGAILTDSNYTATLPGDGVFTAATLPAVNGKFYAEVLLVTVTDEGPSVPHDLALGDVPLTDSVAYRLYGYIASNGSDVFPVTAAQSGDVFMVAIDTASGGAAFGLNGTWMNGADPGADSWSIYMNIVDTPIYLAFGNGNGAEGTNVGTLRSSAAQFTYPVPTGLLPWDQTNA